MSDKEKQAQEYIAGLVTRAREAQKRIEFASQGEVDALVMKAGWATVQPEWAQALADKLAEESGMGRADHKFAKIMAKVKGALRDMKGAESAGIVERDEAKGLYKVAKPMGVVGAIMPVTNGEATPILKALFALKTRNAVVMAPHPKAVQTNKIACDRIRAVLKKEGYPEDLVIPVEQVTLEGSKALMEHADIVLATGGGPMVKAAYSSGTPSQGVGAGNAVTVVDDTADLPDVADKIMRSKTFDNATSCSTENSIVIQDGIYEALFAELEKFGAYRLNADEKKKLQATMWDPEKHVLNRQIVAQPASRIAELAGIDLPEGKTFLLVEETGVGRDYPFSGEKLSPVGTVYRWKMFDDAVDLVNRITTYSGPGHSCGIHSMNNDHIEQLAKAVKVSRVMVRQPQCLANSGAWTNGMPMTLTLGCGSWGGNSASENITWKHLLNYTWVSAPIEDTKPTDEELFGDLVGTQTW